MKTVILGGSRGLGFALQQLYQARGVEARSISRTTNPAADFSKLNLSAETVSLIWDLAPERIVYCAGGGPHGAYATKRYRDHEWAFAVNFLFPSFLLHQILEKPDNWRKLRQICFIGSAIAESKADPMAASYCSAKHALMGLITSIQAEPHGTLDLRLYSPGYMDTGLLPQNAWPRQRPNLVRSPREVAENLATWLESPDSANQHQVFE